MMLADDIIEGLPDRTSEQDFNMHDLISKSYVYEGEQEWENLLLLS